MNYNNFYQKLKTYPLFSTGDLKLILGKEFSPTTIINLQNWQKKGLVVQLRRGLYLLSFDKEKIKPLILASRIYAPSYISMEMALSYYGIIPEAVFTVTSVSSRKTTSFPVPGIGNYSYQTIKSAAFGGYYTYLENGISYNLAEPEKALLDFFYINRNKIDGTKEMFQSYRFSQIYRYNKKRIKQLARYYLNKKTSYLANQFIKFYISNAT